MIYVASPLAGDIEENIKRAYENCRYVVANQAIPFAPHAFFSGFLNDGIKEERSIGMFLGREVLKKCSALWAFCDNGKSRNEGRNSTGKRVRYPGSLFHKGAPVMYGHYGLMPGESIRFTTKEAEKKVTKKVKVIKEYPLFVLVEVSGLGGSYRTSINKSWIFLKKQKLQGYKEEKDMTVVEAINDTAKLSVVNPEDYEALLEAAKEIKQEDHQ